MSETRVISGMRGDILVLSIVILTGITSFTLYRDLAGEGLRNTIYFRTLGPLIYPAFYGIVGYLLIRYGRLFVDRKNYLRLSGASVVIGDRVLPVDDLAITVKRNWLGVREIVFMRDKRREFAVRTYALSAPFPTVQRELELALS